MLFTNFTAFCISQYLAASLPQRRSPSKCPNNCYQIVMIIDQAIQHSIRVQSSRVASRLKCQNNNAGQDCRSQVIKAKAKHLAASRLASPKTGQNSQGQDSHDGQDGQLVNVPDSKQDSLPQNRSPSPRPGRRTRPAGWRRAAGRQLKNVTSDIVTKISNIFIT